MIPSLFRGTHKALRQVRKSYSILEKDFTEIWNTNFYPFTSQHRTTATLNTQESTVNAKEAKKFAKLADHWWDVNGPFKPLHQLNPTRCQFITTSLCDHFNLDHSSQIPLKSLKILDVGCGGGILSEALAKLGAHVTGIDVNDQGIDAAKHHAALDPSLADAITYRTSTIEQLASTGERYDAVIASEVIEHVASVPQFCSSLIEATKPNGTVLISTMNRTARAYALAVVAAEHILRIVPSGTHEWSKFITPEELTMVMSERGAHVEQMAGMLFDPIKGVWILSRDVEVNYIASFCKKS